MQVENIPLLSIICTAYNHEKYIRECLDGFLMQKTDFLFEIIVHDDASTDTTAKIIKEYELKYPNLFNNIYQFENQYSKKDVNIWYDIMLPKAKGKYIAICEGDDYWTDSTKLQKQVNYLEDNAEVGLCHTGYKRYLQNTQKVVHCNMKFSEDNVFVGLMTARYPIATVTTVFRKDIWQQYVIDINPTSKSWIMGDLPFWIYLSRIYKVHYFNTTTSTYRVLDESASHAKQIDKMIQFDESVKDVKMFFLEKYISNDIKEDIEIIKKEVDTIFIYRKLIAYATCKGPLKDFFLLFLQFNKRNSNLRFFLGSIKQIFVRLS